MYDASSIRVVSLALMVVRNPKQWTANGKIEEVLAFFDGIEIAMRHCSPCSLKSPTPSDALEWFKSHETNHVLASHEALPKIRKLYGSDQKAIAALLQWLEDKQV